MGVVFAWQLPFNWGRMQSVAQYSEREMRNIEIVQGLIARNDKKGLVNFLMQEQAHQMQHGALLNETRNSNDSNVNNSDSSNNCSGSFCERANEIA